TSVRSRARCSTWGSGSTSATGCPGRRSRSRTRCRTPRCSPPAPTRRSTGTERLAPFGDLGAFVQSLVLKIPALLLAVTLHEVAHGWVADRLGDPTARLAGRLTLNPLPHIDPFGALAFILAGFGWARPVPVNARNLRRPVRDMALVGLAGPLSNF